MTTSEMEHTQPGRWFWLLWLLATIAGLIVSLAIMFVGLGAMLDNAPEAVFGAVFGGVLGAGYGVAQWVMLRKYVDGIGWWVPLTVVGWTVFWAANIAGLLGEGRGLAGKIVEGIVHGAILGGFVGLLQWLLLRSEISRAGRWILISAVAWSVGAALGDGISTALDGDGPMSILIAFLVSGVIAGIGMMRLLQQGPTAEVGRD